MGIKDEMLYDFSLNMPRVLIGGSTGIIDNVKQILIINDKEIVVNCGRLYASISGENLVVDSLGDKRIVFTGKIRNLEIHGDEQGEG